MQIMEYQHSARVKPSAYKLFSDAIAMPQIIRLTQNLYVAAFRVMKLLPAKYIVKEAINRNEIQNETVVVETSSGTFALGLGIICAELGLNFQIFGDPAIDKELHDRLIQLGGKIHLTHHTPIPGAYQQYRLEALKSYLNENKLAYWARQYDNLDNTRAYYAVGELLMDSLGQEINLVGSVGSGGSTAGAIKPIRDCNPSAKLIGVDTFNSVLFGQPNGKRTLRGLGNSIMPTNLDHALYDEIHWVSAKEAFYHTRQLHQKHAIFCGPTSGAAFQVAQFLALKNKQEKYVFIAPDEGYRYASTVFNDEWMEVNGFDSENICRTPTQVKFPEEANEPWACFNWNRRKHAEVVNHAFK